MTSNAYAGMFFMACMRVNVREKLVNLYYKNEPRRHNGLHCPSAHGASLLG